MIMGTQRTGVTAGNKCPRRFHNHRECPLLRHYDKQAYKSVDLKLRHWRKDHNWRAALRMPMKTQRILSSFLNGAGILHCNSYKWSISIICIQARDWLWTSFCICFCTSISEHKVWNVSMRSEWPMSDVLLMWHVCNLGPNEIFETWHDIICCSTVIASYW